MAQHFLLSAAARSLSPGKVARMSGQGADDGRRRTASRSVRTATAELRFQRRIHPPGNALMPVPSG